MRGLRKSALHRGEIAVAMDEADVVFRGFPDAWCAGRDRARGVDIGGQGLVIDIDQFRCVHRLGQRLRDDESDRVAHIAHTVGDQRGIGMGRLRAPVAALAAGSARQIAQTRGLPVGAREDREHAGRAFRTRRVDGTDARMGMGSAQNMAVNSARRHGIGNVAATAPQQAGVLEARHALPDREVTHALSPLFS